MLTTTQDKLLQARERFGRPFAHEEGSSWKPTNVPFLTRYFRGEMPQLMPAANDGK